MKSFNSKERNELLPEIRAAERQRAAKLQNKTKLSDWVKNFRKKYIVDGFLMPLYAWDGMYSRPRKRISEFGDFIMPYEMVGKVFYKEDRRGWIRQESLWFWQYLIYGQQIIYSREISKLPPHIILGDTPAVAANQELVQITTELGYYGEEGGGILPSPMDIDGDTPINISNNKAWFEEDDDGYLQPYSIPEQPLWIELFQHYEQLENPELEIRPAWFHIANYTIFNVTIKRLPVFCSVLNTSGEIDRFRFFDDNLSDQARDLIGRIVLSLPVQIQEQLNGSAIRRERRQMKWWLYYNVGHPEYKRTLSYREIANIEDVPSRSSIQTTIAQFNRKLREKLDGKLLGCMLLTANSLGLGNNLTYNTLANLGFVPKREREIDGFDELDKLI